MRLFSLIHRVIGFGRRRPMLAVAITHGTSISTMAMLATTLRATATMCGWCEPAPKRMITDFMNRRVIFTSHINVAAGLPRVISYRVYSCRVKLIS